MQLLRPFTNKLKQIDVFLDSKVDGVILILLVTILRLANFFEPYWYGDEAIYLTIGNCLKNGLVLYKDIVDHKTPIIYYLASVPNQFWFRVLNYLWSIVTVLLYFSFMITLTKASKQRLLAFTATIFFTLLTSLMWFEGHIPNGELFVMGFSMIGVNFFIRTKLFNQFANHKNDNYQFDFSELKKLFIGGIFFGLAILTKVPALFDLLAVLLVIFFRLIQKIRNSQNQKNNWLDLAEIRSFLTASLSVIVASGLMIIVSIIYFTLKQATHDYLQFGLLYNLHYFGSWNPHFQPTFLRYFFLLPSKFFIASLAIMAVAWQRKLDNRLRWLFGWFILSLFASLLSNRPYPHYFLQVFPALIALLALALSTTNKQDHNNRKKTLIWSTSSLLLLIFVLKALNVGLYSVRDYYQHFFRYITNQQNYNSYQAKFNPLILENNLVSKFILENQIKEIFVWGNNPILYAQSKTIPTSRYTVAFHIQDMNAYQETIDMIKLKKPKLIIVMKNETDSFPQLFDYLNHYYMSNNVLTQMTLYLRKGY